MRWFLFASHIVVASLGLTASVISVAEEIKECTSANSIMFSECTKEREQALIMRMESAFTNALHRAPEDGKSALLEEQEAWSVYLDKACVYYQDPNRFGREGAIFHFPICRMNIIEDRASQLEALFNRCGSSSC